MNILLVNFNNESLKEISEYLLTLDYSISTAENDLEAVRILNSKNVNEVVIKLTKIMNIGLINYINHHFKHLRPLIITNRNVEEAFSVIKSCECFVMHEPFTLNDFKSNISHLDILKHA